MNFVELLVVIKLREKVAEITTHQMIAELLPDLGLWILRLNSRSFLK